MRRPISPVLTVLVLAAMGVLFLVFPGPRLLPYPYCAAGLLPLGGGLGIALAGRAQFIRSGTCLSPFQNPRTLVVDGLFRYSRNPMYVGLSLLVVGAAVFLGTCTPFLPVAIFVIVIDQIYIPAEERTLIRVFGDAYTRYREVTPRWI